MATEKNSEELKLRLPPSMYLDLSREAARADRSVSDYVRHVLGNHLYGVASRVADGAPEE